MTLYAESSAVLAWLFGESEGKKVLKHLKSSDTIVTSDLTMIECSRVLIRAYATGQITEVQSADRRAILAAASSSWHFLHIQDDVCQRAQRTFPIEPIRSLDAIHLAAALFAKSAVRDLSILSLDHRIRDNARALGFEILPQ
jgi:predicted nucleic acid-binding protein